MGCLLSLQIPLIFIFFFQSMASPSIFEGALPPILSPIIGKACDGVSCGQGNCTASSNETFGYYCKCDAGWSQFDVGDDLRFMPCVIPDCNVDYSCQDSSPPTAAPPTPTNQSFSDPCTWSYCGGGTCVKTSTLGYRCDCKTGYSNLLNSTSYPCFKECSMGADCAKLGIGPTNSSSATTNSSAAGSEENHAWSGLSENLLWLIGTMISLLVIPGARS